MASNSEPQPEPTPPPLFDLSQMREVADAHLAEEILQARSEHTAEGRRDAVALVTAALNAIPSAFSSVLADWLEPDGTPNARTHVLVGELLLLGALTVSGPHRRQGLPVEDFPVLRVHGFGPAAALQNIAAQTLTAVVRGDVDFVRSAVSTHLDPAVPSVVVVAPAFILSVARVCCAALNVEAFATRRTPQQVLAAAGAAALT